MDIKQEFSKLKASFWGGGILTRVLLVIGFFFSLSSITTLSSKIVGWKGFILEGINFYKEYYVDNVAVLAGAVGLRYTQTEIHTATVTCIAVCVGMRILAMGQKVAFKVINARYEGDLKPNLKIFAFIAIFFTIGIWLWYGVFDPPIFQWFVVTVILGYPLIIVFTKKLMAKKDYEYFEEREFNYIVSYYAYVLALLICLGSLAAINSGLIEKPNKNSQQDAAQNAASLL